MQNQTMHNSTHTSTKRMRTRPCNVRILKNFLFDDFTEEHGREPSPYELTTLMLTTVCQPDLPVLLERIRSEYRRDGEWALRTLKQEIETGKQAR